MPAVGRLWPSVNDDDDDFENIKEVLTRYSLLNSNSEKASWRNSHDSSKAVRIGSFEYSRVF